MAQAHMDHFVLALHSLPRIIVVGQIEPYLRNQALPFHSEGINADTAPIGGIHQIGEQTVQRPALVLDEAFGRRGKGHNAKQGQRLALKVLIAEGRVKPLDRLCQFFPRAKSPGQNWHTFPCLMKELSEECKAVRDISEESTERRSHQSGKDQGDWTIEIICEQVFEV